MNGLRAAQKRAKKQQSRIIAQKQARQVREDALKGQLGDKYQSYKDAMAGARGIKRTNVQKRNQINKQYNVDFNKLRSQLNQPKPALPLAGANPAAPAVGANPAASLANDGTTMRMPAMQPPTPTQPGTPLQQEQPRTIGPAEQEQQMKDQLMPATKATPGWSSPNNLARPWGTPPPPMGQPPQGAGAPQAPAQDNSALDQQIAALQKQIADLQGQKK